MDGALRRADTLTPTELTSGFWATAQWWLREQNAAAHGTVHHDELAANPFAAAVRSFAEAGWDMKDPTDVVTRSGETCNVLQASPAMLTEFLVADWRAHRAARHLADVAHADDLRHDQLWLRPISDAFHGQG